MSLPTRPKGKGIQKPLPILFTLTSVGPSTSHIFGEGNVASGIVHDGHRLQDKGLKKDNAGEVPKGSGMTSTAHRDLAAIKHALELGLILATLVLAAVAHGDTRQVVTDLTAAPRILSGVNR
jgi:hypothetical protein